MNEVDFTVLHEQEVERLLRAIGYSDGFALCFAVYDDLGFRERVIERLRLGLDDRLSVLDMGDPENLSGYSSGDGTIVVKEFDTILLSNEVSLSGVKASVALFLLVNMGRDIFFKLERRPFVIWLRDEAMTVLARNAPDLFDYRSGVFDFRLQGKDDKARSR